MVKSIHPGTLYASIGIIRASNQAFQLFTFASRNLYPFPISMLFVVDYKSKVIIWKFPCIPGKMLFMSRKMIGDSNKTSLSIHSD